MIAKHQPHTPTILQRPAAFVAATLLQLFAPSVLFVAFFATLVALWQGIGLLLGFGVSNTAVYTCLGITTCLAAWQGKTILVGINEAFRVQGAGSDTYLRNFTLYCRKLEATQTPEPLEPAATPEAESRRNIHLA